MGRPVEPEEKSSYNGSYVFGMTRSVAASTMVPSRIRTTDGGSGRYWWRPGAPIALVLDHITPAFVYELPVPITVGPGDALDVELEVPLSTTFPDDGTATTPTFNLGVSFNGYAAIEG